MGRLTGRHGAVTGGDAAVDAAEAERRDRQPELGARPHR